MGEDQLDDLELDGPITLRILDGTAWDFTQAKWWRWWKTVRCGGLISSCCLRNPHGKAGNEERRKCFMEVQFAGHLWDFSQSLANARVSISPNKFRFSGWGIESKTFIIKFLCVAVIQNYQSGSRKKRSVEAFVWKKMNTAISMPTKILVMKSRVIMQLNMIDYKDLTQTVCGEESTQQW